MESNESQSKKTEAVKLEGLSRKPDAEGGIEQEAALTHYIDVKRQLDAANIRLFRETGEWPITEAIADFRDQLKAKYKVDDYHMFHLLGGSTLGRPAPHFDFPGEDSVANFLDNLADKYLGEEAKEEAV